MPPHSEPLTARQQRSIVTEEALSVSPAVLGLPLAAPWRRGAAIAIDGALVAILANAPSVVFGFAAALVLFRASRRTAPGAGYIKRSFRFMLRMGGALVLFVVAVSLWGSVTDRIGGGDGERLPIASVSMDGSAEVEMTGMQAARFANEVFALRRASDEGDARAAAQRLLQGMRASGMSGSDARNAVREVAGDDDERPWIAAAVEAALVEDERAELASASPEVPAEAEPTADSIVVAYSAALASADSVAADSLRPLAVTILAADTIRTLDGRIEALNDERGELRTRVEELEEEIEEGPGMMAFLRSVLEDLGLGLGWIGLYFTATTAMWQGRTPGKRLLGIRVIRLTGRPVGWWASFERVGGYAAGVATGLLGFLQIFWDDNRQATHDKIAATTVIRDAPREGPAS